MEGSTGGYLVITELFLPTKGGTAVWFDEVYRRLGGKEVHIITADVPGSAQHDGSHPNAVHRIRLKRYAFLRPESLIIYAKFLVASFRTAWRARVVAVHAGRVLPEGLVGWIVARVARRPLVIYAHGEELTTWRQPMKLRAMTWTYRHADMVIANSDYTRGELLKLGVAQERIRMLNPGVNVQRFRPGLPCDDLKARIGIAPDERFVLSVGRLTRRKGFDQVVRAIASLVQGGLRVRYAIIGIGEDLEYIRALAKELGVTDRVHMLSHVDAEELPRWYNAADVVAMPNRDINGDTEGFGLVFLEAAACGKPTVAGLAGGTGAAVIHGVTGLRVDGESTAAIAEALKCLLTLPKLAADLGDRGLSRARAEFSWERVARQTEIFQRELTQS